MIATTGHTPAHVHDRGTRRRQVVCYTVGGTAAPSGHQDVTRRRIAGQIADLLGYEAGGEYTHAAHEQDTCPYFVPDRTLTLTHAERALGIASEADLYGGVVPQAHVATKIITHPLLGNEADAPEGWSREFGAHIAEAVLPGYSAFTIADARRAALLLLQHGPVRIKRACETGGRGQFVATAAREVDIVLAGLDAVEIARDGIVLEQNLEALDTFSVGQLRVGPWRASYYGVQHLTQDHHGASVYGGSTLLVVRGDYDALLERALDRCARIAIEQARCYDRAAGICFPGFYASRRNYDVAQGVDASGRMRAGVLEQSWRIGGASSAEVCALEVFAADPERQAVIAAATEVYGPCAVPQATRLYYQGEDPQVGPISKYVLVHPL